MLFDPCKGTYLDIKLNLMYNVKSDLPKHTTDFDSINWDQYNNIIYFFYY